MKLHLHMLAKSIQIVLMGFLAIVMVCLMLLASAGFAQWRVDQNMIRQEMAERVLEVVE